MFRFALARTQPVILAFAAADAIGSSPAYFCRDFDAQWLTSTCVVYPIPTRLVCMRQ
jgi:hypothetical protein